MSSVLHVVPELARGGAQRVALETAARLHHDGRPQLLVTGAAPEGAGLVEEAERRLGPRLKRLKHLQRDMAPVDDAFAVLELSQLIDRTIARYGAPAVVHSHTRKGGLIGRLAAASVRGARVVHTVHGFGLEAFGPRHRWLLEAIERVAAVQGTYVFVREADRREAEALNLLHGAQTRVIRAGIDVAAFQIDDDTRTTLRRKTRAALGIDEDATLAVTVANLKPQKDPLFHVEILARWCAHRPDAHLVLLGDGPLREATLALARERGVLNRLRLPGFVDDVRPTLAAADVFLLASAWEGLPCSVLEATAFGLPCVVRDTGWADDLTWAKSVKALPSTAPPSAFADALDALIAKKPRIAKVKPEFTLDGMIRDLAALYDDVAGLPRPTEREGYGMRKRRRRPPLSRL